MSDDGSLNPKVGELIDSIGGLTVLELAELVKALEDKFGVSAAAPMMMAAAPGDGDAAPEEEKDSFDVVITGPGAGIDVTAMAVLGDVLRIAAERADTRGGSRP